MDEEEKNRDNAKILYQSVMQLRIHWSSVIVRNIHYTIILVSAIWGILGKAYIDSLDKSCYGFGFGPWYIFVAALLSSIIIILWRWYSHYLDNQIVELYPEMVFYEGLLDAKDKGTWWYLMKKFLECTNKVDGLETLCPEHRKKVVEELIKMRRIRRRGHHVFNIIALILLIIMWTMSIYFSRSQPIIFYMSIIGLLFFIGAFILVLCWLSQRNPSRRDIIDSIDYAKKQEGNAIRHNKECSICYETKGQTQSQQAK